VHLDALRTQHASTINSSASLFSKHPTRLLSYLALGSSCCAGRGLAGADVNRDRAGARSSSAWRGAGSARRALALAGLRRCS
jgi:hypothetical protein